MARPLRINKINTRCGQVRAYVLLSGFAAAWDGSREQGEGTASQTGPASQQHVLKRTGCPSVLGMALERQAGCPSCAQLLLPPSP